MPERLDQELIQAKDLGINPKTLVSVADLDGEFAEIINAGTIKGVVTEQSKLVIIPKWIGTSEIAHSVLTQGKSVLGAGEAEIIISAGQCYGVSIDNHSGHYQPSKESLELGKKAFEKLGIRFL